MRNFLRRLASIGLGLTCLAACLSLANLVNADPVDLHRLRDLFLAFVAFVLLLVVSADSPRHQAGRIVERCRDAFDHPKAFAWISGLLLGLYVIDAATHHLAFQTGSHDFSMIDEAVRSAAREGTLFSPVLGRSFLSEHFSPILFLFAPLHRAVDSPWYLVLAQPLLLWAAVFPFRALLRDFTDLKRAQVNLLSLVFLNHPLMISTLEYLFHMECALPLLLFSTIYAGEKKSYVVYALGLLAVLCIKEDFGIYIAGLGVFYALFRRRPIVGIVTCAIGVAWTLLAVKLAMPGFADSHAGYQFASRWESWGNTPAAIAAGFAAHPFRFVSCLFGKDMLLLLLSLAFVPLMKLRKGYWVVFVVPWVINATSDFDLQSELELYYGLPILSFMLVAVIFGLQDKAIAWPGRPRVGAALAAFLMVANGFYFTLPYVPRSRADLLHGISTIPKEETVTASGCFFPVLGYDKKKILIESMEPPSTAFTLLKQGDGSWPLSKDQSHAYAALCLEQGYTILWQYDDFICFKKTLDHHEATPRE